MLDRLKQYIESKGLTIAAVERKLGMSNGALAKPIKNGTSIGSDKLENILTICPDMSLTWLFTGRGDMLNTDNNTPVNDSNTAYIENRLLKKMLSEKEMTILKQAEEIGELKARIKELEQRLGKTAGDANIGGTANAG
jgi:transcriptional regulator with XRE-family HTH domain